MSAPPARASHAFWIFGCVIVFALHAFGIFRWGDRRQSAPVWKRPAPFLYVGGDTATDEQLGLLTGMRDPALFALPHPHGFSGGAWQKFQPELPKLSNWTAPPEWLALPADQLGNTLSEYVATNRPSTAPLLAALRATEVLEVRVPGEPIVTNTTARVEGPLAARKLLISPPLPSAVHNDILKNTIVAVSVNGDGMVESASLIGESGSRDADATAVELAGLFQFERVKTRNAQARAVAPAIGRIVFIWQAVPPANGAAASPR